MAFNASTSTETTKNCTIRIERTQPAQAVKSQGKTDKEAVWAKAKSYAHDRLWFGYVLPGLLENEGVDTSRMNTSQMCSAVSDIWDAKVHEVNGQLSVIMDFTREDLLLEGYKGEKPSKYNRETGERDTIELHALGTIGSNDFRYFVMEGDAERSACIPRECFFGTYPIKDRVSKEIIKGKFRCVLKARK